MGIFRNGKYDSDTQSFENLSAKTINDIVLEIQNGDEKLRNSFIKSFEPFIVKSVSKVVGSFIVPENSEEFSIGLNAFNEAIDKFDEKKYFVFFSFAQQVIRRRIIDYIRVNSKKNRTLPFTSFEKDGNDFEEKYLTDDSKDEFEEVEYKEEIEQFEYIIGKFGIGLEELVEVAPKHKDSRLSCVRIAKLLSENDDLYKKLNKNRSLPYKELESLSGFSKRTLQRNNKFIIAVTIVFKYKFEIFKSYITDFKKE